MILTLSKFAASTPCGRSLEIRGAGFSCGTTIRKIIGFELPRTAYQLFLSACGTGNGLCDNAELALDKRAHPTVSSPKTSPAYLPNMDSPEQPLTFTPDDFRWKPRCHLDRLPAGVFLHSEIVASMHQRINGAWLVLNTPQWSCAAAAPSVPAAKGCELRALRHVRALRRRVAISSIEFRTTSCCKAGA